MRAHKGILGCVSHTLALQAHPDMNPALDTTQEAVRLNEAYAVLQLVSERLLMSPSQTPGSCLLSVYLKQPSHAPLAERRAGSAAVCSRHGLRFE